MDELQRQMQEIAGFIAGGVRAPGPTAARRRGRRLRRRARAGRILAIALVVGVVPIARWFDLPASTNGEPQVATSSSVVAWEGFRPLTPESYLPLTPENYLVGPVARWLAGDTGWLGPIEIVASGQQLGHRWRVVAYGVMSEAGRVSVCASFEFEHLTENRRRLSDDNRPLGSSICDSGQARMAWGLQTYPRESLLAGMVTERATMVRLHLIDGTFQDTPAVQASDSLDIKFFAFALPYDADGRMLGFEARDGRGRTLCSFPPRGLGASESVSTGGGAFDCP